MTERDVSSTGRLFKDTATVDWRVTGVFGSGSGHFCAAKVDDRERVSCGCKVITGREDLSSDSGRVDVRLGVVGPGSSTVENVGAGE